MPPYCIVIFLSSGLGFDTKLVGRMDICPSLLSGVVGNLFVSRSVYNDCFYYLNMLFDKDIVR